MIIEKIISEIDEKIKLVNEAVKKNDFQIKEIEKRLHSSKLLPVGFNPVEINNKIVDLKMEKYRLNRSVKIISRFNFWKIHLFQKISKA